MNRKASRRDSITNMIVPTPDVFDEYRPLLEGTQIQPYPYGGREIPVDVLKRYNETELLLSTNNLANRFLGYAPVFSDTRVFFGKDSDWAVMNLTDDPVFRVHRKKVYAPLAAVEEVQTIIATGIDFDAVIIAHELPKDALKQGEQVAFDLITPPPSVKVHRRLNFMERTVGVWWSLIMKASVGAVAIPAAAGAATVIAGTALIAAGAKTFASTATAASEAMAANAAAAKALAAQEAAARAAAAANLARVTAGGYDPALLGVQFDPRWTIEGKPIGLWYYLTAWVWPEV